MLANFIQQYFQKVKMQPDQIDFKRIRRENH